MPHPVHECTLYDYAIINY